MMSVKSYHANYRQLSVCVGCHKNRNSYLYTDSDMLASYHMNSTLKIFFQCHFEASSKSNWNDNKETWELSDAMMHTNYFKEIRQRQSIIKVQCTRGSCDDFVVSFSSCTFASFCALPYVVVNVLHMVLMAYYLSHIFIVNW